MNNPPNQKAVIWLTRNGLFLYGEFMQSVINLTIPTEIVSYLEVVDENKLIQLIQSFAHQYQLPPLHTYIIVGPDALIDKSVDTDQLITNKDLEKQILEVIPFENTYSTNVLIGNQTHIIAFNANFYQSLKTAFEKINWSIESVTPYTATGQTSFNQQIASTFLQNLHSLTQHNLIKTIVHGSQSEMEKTNQPPPSKNANLIKLLLVFFVLIVVMVVMLVLRRGQTSSDSPAISPTVNPSPIITQPVVQSTASAELSPQSQTTQSGNLNIKPSPTPTNYPITITP